MHHFVKNLKSSEPLELWILVEVDATAGDTASQHLVGERQANGCEAQGLHCSANGLQALHVQSSNNMILVTSDGDMGSLLQSP